MNDIPCRERLFPLRISAINFYPPYLRWLKHLGERLGMQNTLSIWRNTFAEVDDALLMTLLSSGCRELISDEIDPETSINKLIAEIFSASRLEISNDEVRNLIEHTPPIAQIKRLFANDTVEKDITAFEALHLRFDSLAHLAEAIIKTYGKQGELIIYDMMVEGRLAVAKGEAGSVEEFIDAFTVVDSTPNLFTAGLQTELISRTNREAVLFVRECEWARYFRERHPNVGYLMACSTDEAAYKAFNSSLRMQRTRTLMEGGEMCDFKIYAIGEDSISQRRTENQGG